MGLIIHPSARRHGVSERDILHAYRNAVDFFPADDPEEDLMMAVGADESGRLLEVGFRKTPSGRRVVFHAMPARPKYLRRR